MKHTATALPTEALNKGTEPILETAKRSFGTRCTARVTSQSCKGYSYADKLMPCHILDNNKKACGIEDKCVSCFNLSNRTDHYEKEFSNLAKEVRYRRFNRVDKPKGVDEMKKFDRSADTTFMTNLLTDEFPWLDDRFRRLAIKLSRAARITFKMNLSKN